MHLQVTREWVWTEVTREKTGPLSTNLIIFLCKSGLSSPSGNPVLNKKVYAVSVCIITIEFHTGIRYNGRFCRSRLQTTDLVQEV